MWSGDSVKVNFCVRLSFQQTVRGRSTQQSPEQLLIQEAVRKVHHLQVHAHANGSESLYEPSLNWL